MQHSKGEQEAALKATAVRSPLPAGNVGDSSLSLSSPLGAGGGMSGGGRGQGTFYPPCHILHYHMVLRPEGTSHNQWVGSQHVVVSEFRLRIFRRVDLTRVVVLGPAFGPARTARWGRSHWPEIRTRPSWETATRVSCYGDRRALATLCCLLSPLRYRRLFILW